MSSGHGRGGHPLHACAAGCGLPGSEQCHRGQLNLVAGCGRCGRLCRKPPQRGYMGCRSASCGDSPRRQNSAATSSAEMGPAIGSCPQRAEHIGEEQRPERELPARSRERARGKPIRIFGPVAPGFVAELVSLAEAAPSVMSSDQETSGDSRRTAGPSTPVAAVRR